jgi:hypothetical protein
MPRLPKAFQRYYRKTRPLKNPIRGRPPSSPRYKVGTQLLPALFRRLRAYAKANDMTMTSIVETALEKFFEEVDRAEDRDAG